VSHKFCDRLGRIHPVLNMAFAVSLSVRRTVCGESQLSRRFRSVSSSCGSIGTHRPAANLLADRSNDSRETFELDDALSFKTTHSRCRRANVSIVRVSPGQSQRARRLCAAIFYGGANSFADQGLTSVCSTVGCRRVRPMPSWSQHSRGPSDNLGL
jgi:hypothetical protein